MARCLFLWQEKVPGLVFCPKSKIKFGWRNERERERERERVATWQSTMSYYSPPVLRHPIVSGVLWVAHVHCQTRSVTETGRIRKSLHFIYFDIIFLNHRWYSTLTLSSPSYSLIPLCWDTAVSPGKYLPSSHQYERSIMLALTYGARN